MTVRHAIVPAYIVLCLTLGGASAAGFAANLLLQLLALPLIGWGLWTMRREPPAGPVRTLLLLLTALLALCVVQLIPLPPAIWTLLPGRAPVVRGYELLGVALPWLPLTLAPERALASLLWLLPAIATLLGVAVLGAFRARWIAWSILAVAAVAVGLGALQVVGGAYLYRVTNYGVAVGFFANANHNATLLLACIPLVAALQVSLARRAKSRRNASAVTVLTVAAFAVIVVGLLTNLSLAGIGLCVPVSLVSYLAIVRGERPGRSWLGIAAALLSVGAIAVIVAGPFGNNLVGQQHEHREDSRQVSFARTLSAAGEYLPFGSGVGSFLQVYHTQEPPTEVTRTFMNHAHSDWIELLLETGVPGMALAGVFLWWWISRARAIWRADEIDLFGRAACVVTGTVMVHSLVDYPLRTAALSAVFAACLALMAGVRPYVRRSRMASSSRHMSV